MGKQGKQCQTVFLGSKITADGDCSHEIKRHLLLGRKAMTNLDSILKSRDITLPIKVLLVKAMVFPVVMYGCESWAVKKVEHRRIEAFELWCWRRLLRVPWTARRSSQSILKEINTGCSLEELMLKLKLQYFGYLMWRVDSLEKTWCWEGLGAGGEGDNRERDGWMASPTRWTWVWVNSRSWWWTGRPGELWIMGLQTAGHSWVNGTKLKDHVSLGPQYRAEEVSAFLWKMILKLPSSFETEFGQQRPKVSKIYSLLIQKVLQVPSSTLFRVSWISLWPSVMNA